MVRVVEVEVDLSVVVQLYDDLFTGPIGVSVDLVFVVVRQLAVPAVGHAVGGCGGDGAPCRLFRSFPQPSKRMPSPSLPKDFTR